MKKLITFALILSLILIVDSRCPVVAKPKQQQIEPQPQFLLQCIVAGLILTGGYFLVRGIIKICNKCLPPPPPPPPTNLPPNLQTNYPYTNALPAFDMPIAEVTTNQTVLLEFQDGTGQPWQVQYRITVLPTPSGVLASVFDPAGNLLATNLQTGSLYNGDLCTMHDFSQSLPPIKDSPRLRLYRLVSTPQPAN